jgi:hypothetical protein
MTLARDFLPLGIVSDGADAALVFGDSHELGIFSYRFSVVSMLGQHKGRLRKSQCGLSLSETALSYAKVSRPT